MDLKKSCKNYINKNNNNNNGRGSFLKGLWYSALDFFITTFMQNLITIMVFFKPSYKPTISYLTLNFVATAETTFCDTEITQNLKLS